MTASHLLIKAILKTAKCIFFFDSGCLDFSQHLPFNWLINIILNYSKFENN